MAYTPDAFFKTFKVTKVSTNGSNTTFSIKALYGQAEVYDSASTKDSAADSNVQIGDIANDKYTAVFQSGAQAGKPFVETYVGSTADHSSFIGKYVTGGKTYYYLYTNKANYSANTGTVTVSANNGPVMICFASGTQIRTSRGEINVENLVVGDLALTASGATRPIRWLGHRTVDCTSHNTPSQTWPVRILAGAFGPGLPARDLYVSPGHPILVGADEDGEGGHLVPAMCLINGTTIDRVTMDSVTYWHIELDAHDILLAEGLPAESYLDWGDRAFFSEADEHALMNPDFVVPGLAGRCRPVALDGPVVEAERRRLDAVWSARLAQACAWPRPELLALI